MTDVLVERELGLLEALRRFRGTTVTIYTTSGGQSGIGFTGVLAEVGPRTITLITRIGPAPGCALGSGCIGGRLGGDFGFFGGIGSETIIPVDRIAAFVHNAI